MISNLVRPTSVTYPDGRQLDFDYGTSGGIDDAASRIQAIKDGTLALVQYAYLGQATFVEADDTEPEVKWTLIDLAGNNDPDTGDIYSGLDRFGRVKDNRWYDDGASADADRIKYGYDRAGNRLWRENVVAVSLNKDFDELYAYDGLYRLADMQRGRLNAQKDAITSPTFAQQWLLDATGNWSNFKQDDDGDGTWDLDQDRTANMVNEITDVTETTGPSWVTPAYSLAGNMTTVPQPVDPTASYAAAFDAWNRLVKLTAGANTVQENEYDGLRRRTVRKDYISGTLDETRHFYYSDSWQVFEERLNSSTDPDRQFVWGLRYIDDCVLRDRDTNGDGTLDERLYALQDANWNVTAAIDASADVQERDAYQPYGQPLFLDPAFVPQSASSFDWDTLFAGYKWNQATGIYLARNRVLHPALGVWTQRDLVTRIPRNVYVVAANNPVVRIDLLFRSRKDSNLYRYVLNNPTGLVDPMGEQALIPLGAGQAAPSGGLNQAADILGQLRRWLDAIPCKCELAVSGIPAAIDNLLISNRPNGKPQWPWQHCTSNCMMVSLCGGGQEAEQCAAWLSLAKEVLDVVACVLLDRGMGDSCDSAFQQCDFQDDVRGRDFGRCCTAFGPIGASLCCALACAGRFNVEEGGGKECPFGPIGNPPGPWPDWDELLADLW